MVLVNVRSVRQAAVVFCNQLNSIVAFVVPKIDLTIEPLRNQLAQRVSAVMLPAMIKIKQDLPLTPSGKIDRNNLLSTLINENPKTEQLESSNIGLASKEVDNDSHNVAQAWCEVLNLQEVPLDVNFFDLGGHSLMVFKLQQALQQRTGKRLSIVSLFKHTTVTAQAKLIRENNPEVALHTHVNLSRRNIRPVRSDQLGAKVLE